MKRIPLFSLLFLLLAGCAIEKRIPVTEYSYTPTVKIQSVEVLINGQDAEISTAGVDVDYKDEAERNQTYSDDIISVYWEYTHNAIRFMLQNNTTKTIRILWDEVTYVSPDNISHGILHDGVRYIDAGKPMMPSVVVRSGSLTDVIIPSDYVYYSSIFKDWIHRDLFSDIDSIIEDKVEKKANEYVGQIHQVLMPLDVGGVIHEYLFVFKVEGYRINSNPSWRWSTNDELKELR